LLSARGKPLQLEDVEIVAGSGAVPFNRKRFGGQPVVNERAVERTEASESLRKAARRKKR
jgi:hypothetical protein